MARRRRKVMCSSCCAVVEIWADTRLTEAPPWAPSSTHCNHCGKRINQKGCHLFPRRYCSNAKRCQRAAAAKRKSKRRQEAARLKKQCRRCGKPVAPFRSFYCGQECADRARKEKADRNSKRARKEKVESNRRREWRHKCIKCGRGMHYCGNRRTTCSLTCEWRFPAWHKGNRSLSEHRCKGCGDRLHEHNKHGYCWNNLECRNAAARVRDTQIREARAKYIECVLCGASFRKLRDTRYCPTCVTAGYAKADKAQRRKPLDTLRRRAQGMKPQNGPSAKYCKVCGAITGWWYRSARIAKQADYCEKHRQKCAGCGEPTWSRKGLCTRCNLAAPRMRIGCCELCGGPTWSAHGVCACNDDCRREQDRRRKNVKTKTLRPLVQAV
jgi:hypothetical protein